MEPVRLTSPEGVEYRDLNGNGQMEPFEDPRRPVDERVEDLLGRMSLAEKAGLLFHDDHRGRHRRAALMEGAGAVRKSPTGVVVLDKLINHFNVHALRGRAEAAQWPNALQELAERHRTPSRSRSHRPAALVQREHRRRVRGRAFSQWPEPLGLAALGTRAGRGVRRHRPPGVRGGRHPGRAAPADRPGHGAAVGAAVRHLRRGRRPRRRAGGAYIEGFQRDELGPRVGGDHDQALPRRRPAEGRRGPALPLRP